VPFDELALLQLLISFRLIWLRRDLRKLQIPRPIIFI